MDAIVSEPLLGGGEPRSLQKPKSFLADVPIAVSPDLSVATQVVDSGD